MFPDPTAPPVIGAAPGGASPAVQSGPDKVLAELISGNRRFLTSRPNNGCRVSSVAAASDQLPRAAVVGCMDGRVPVEAIFDVDLGSVCVIRSAGHVLDRAVLASVELAVETLGVRLLLVLGHRRCAAVAAAVDAQRTGRRPDGNVGFVIDKISRSVTEDDIHRHDATDVVIRRHVARTVKRLRTAVSTWRPADEVRVAGAIYDVDTGWVHLL